MTIIPSAVTSAAGHAYRTGADLPSDVPPADLWRLGRDASRVHFSDAHSRWLRPARRPAYPPMVVRPTVIRKPVDKQENPVCAVRLGDSLVVDQNPSADRCLSLQLAAPFFLQPITSSSVRCSDLPGSSQRSPRPARTGPLRNPMNAMAPTRPTTLNGCRVRLTTGPAAAAEARSQVRSGHLCLGCPCRPGRRGPAHQRTGDQCHQARAGRDRHACHQLLLRSAAR